MTFFKELGVQSMFTQFCNRNDVLLYASNWWMGNEDNIEGSVDVCNSDSPLVAQSRKEQHCIPDNAQEGGGCPNPLRVYWPGELTRT